MSYEAVKGIIYINLTKQRVMPPVLCQLNISNGNVIADAKLILNVAGQLHRDNTKEINLPVQNN